jgi:hypothetical protein
MDQQKIKEIADSVRLAHWANKNLPVNTEHIIEFGIRLDIQPIPNLFSSFGIDAWLKLDCTGIIVDEGEYLNERFENRLRFSFAHELGHFFLHRQVLGKVIINSLEEWQEFILSIPEKEYGSFEFQANEFGGRLIVPLLELKAHVARACDKLKEEKNSLIKYLVKDPDLVLSCISPFLCRPFGVSEEVIEKRVKKEGLWPPRTHFPDLF